MAQSLCGSVISSRKALLSLLWSIVTLFSLGAFMTAALLAVRIEGRYHHLASEYRNNYYDDDSYQWYLEHCVRRDQNEGGGGGGGGGRALEGEDGNDNKGGDQKDGEGGGSADHEHEDDRCKEYDPYPYDDDNGKNGAWPYSYYPNLASTSSFAVKFAALYTAALAMALSLYGSLAVVGFSSVRGQYIAPCLDGGLSMGGGRRGSGASVGVGRGSGVVGVNAGAADSAVRAARAARMRVGTFIGCLVFFSNMCLVIGVVLGEFRVEDYFYYAYNNGGYRTYGRGDVDSYAIERISRVMAVLCIFLAVIYGTYAVLVYAFKDDIISSDDVDDGGAGGGGLMGGLGVGVGSGGGVVVVGGGNGAGINGGGAGRNSRRMSGHMDLSRIGRGGGGSIVIGGMGGRVNVDGGGHHHRAYEPPLSPVGVVGVSAGVVGKIKKDSDGFLTTQATAESY